MLSLREMISAEPNLRSTNIMSTLGFDTNILVGNMNQPLRSGLEDDEPEEEDAPSRSLRREIDDDMYSPKSTSSREC